MANRLTQVVSNENTNIKIVRNLIPTSFYGQDQWTTGRLTLQGGVRYDHLATSYPDQFFGGLGYNASAPVEVVLSVAVDPGRQLERRHRPHGRGVRPVRQRQDSREVQPG